MNAKKSLIIFGFYAVWLTLVVLSFAHAAKTVGENTQNGIIWFGVSLLTAVLGIWIAIKLNRMK